MSKIVRQATNKQLIVFCWWFITGNRKADIIIHYVNLGGHFYGMYKFLKAKNMKPPFLYFIKQLAIVMAFVTVYTVTVWYAYGFEIKPLLILMLLVLSIMIVALWNILKST